MCELESSKRQQLRRRARRSGFTSGEGEAREEEEDERTNERTHPQLGTGAGKIRGAIAFTVDVLEVVAQQSALREAHNTFAVRVRDRGRVERRLCV